MQAYSKFFRFENLQGKVVLITGAGAGIGQAITLGFAEQQCKLILVDYSQQGIEETIDMVKTHFKESQIHPVTLDVRDAEKVSELPVQMPAEFKNVEILVNNAGVGIAAGSIEKVDLKQAAKLIDVNVKGLINFARTFTPGMLEQKSGHLICITSGLAHDALPEWSVYNGSKFAQRGIMDAIRKDMSDTPLRITSISPGIADTKFHDTRYPDDKNKAQQTIKLGALNPMDVADAVIYAATRPLHVQVHEVIVKATTTTTHGNYTKGSPQENHK